MINNKNFGIPYPWTIGREEVDDKNPKWFGLNRLTGEETVRYPSYGEALKEVERREVKEKGTKIGT